MSVGAKWFQLYAVRRQETVTKPKGRLLLLSIKDAIWQDTCVVPSTYQLTEGRVSMTCSDSRLSPDSG